jgi:y4mF family transcriptional regulator
MKTGKSHTTSPVARSIKKRRKLLGMTQYELAQIAGCGLDFIYDLENGKPTVRFDKLLAVIMALGLEFKLQDGKNGITIAEGLS